MSAGPAEDIKPQRRALLRVLGSAFGIAMVVGATIGGGILSAPGSVAAQLPTTALFIGVWIFGGVNALLGATAYAELGAMIPRSGGIYTFSHRAFGNGVGFLVGYVDWVNWCVSSAALLLLVGEYLGAIVGPLASHATTAAFLVFAGLAAVQWAGVRSGGRVQEITTVLKTVALVGLVIAAFVLPHAAPPAATAAVAAPHGTALLLAFGIAIPGVVFSYDSYYAVVYCSGEIEDPGRVIPRSIFRGLFLVIGVYLLINVAFLHLLPVTRLAGDPFVGATVTKMLFGPRGDVVIRLIMIVAVIGTINSQIIASPRVLLAMAQDRLFPAQATRVSASGTPTIALSASLLLIAVFLFSRSFEAAIAVDAFIILLLYLTVFASLFALRRSEPDADRPYRAWGYPLVPGLAFVITAILLVAMSFGDHLSALIALGILVVSWPASLVVRRVMAIERDTTHGP